MGVVPAMVLPCTTELRIGTVNAGRESMVIPPERISAVFPVIVVKSREMSWRLVVMA